MIVRTASYIISNSWIASPQEQLQLRKKGFMCIANLAYIIISRTEWFSRKHTIATEMMYSLCKSDSSLIVHYVKSKATLSQQNL
jgi:hypothetical protein